MTKGLMEDGVHLWSRCFSEGLMSLHLLKRAKRLISSIDLLNCHSKPIRDLAAFQPTVISKNCHQLCSLIATPLLDPRNVPYSHERFRKGWVIVARWYNYRWHTAQRRKYLIRDINSRFVVSADPTQCRNAPIAFYDDVLGRVRRVGADNDTLHGKIAIFHDGLL